MRYDFIRSCLFKLPAELSHDLSLKLLNFIPSFFSAPIKNIKPQRVMGIDFPHPVGLAAGLDKNGDYLLGLSQLGFSFIEVGTVTARPQQGNKKPRLFRLNESQAIINRMGFNSKGIDYLIKKIKQVKFKGILGINIGKNADTPIQKAIDDYLICLRKIYPYASYITINISSPNTPELRRWQEVPYLDSLLFSLKQEQAIQTQKENRYVPLVIKIAPDLTPIEIENIARLLLKHNVDGVIATNTTIQRKDLSLCRFSNESGGLSGKPLTALSTMVIKRLHATLKNQIPIIGVGGIMMPEDAIKKLEAGACLLQVYTGLIYQGPELIHTILAALEKT